MDPALKRQRISAPAAQERFCEEKARFFSSLKRPQTLDNSASHKDCNGFTRFYGAVNAREKGFTSYEEAENFEEAEVDDEDMYEDMSEDDAYEEEAPEANMEAARQKLDNKLKSTFEAIFEKYGKDFSGIGDEIDLRTGEIIVDNGHLAEMHNETDAGKGRGRGILRAFTEEPEQAGFSRHGGEDNVEDYYDVDEASDSMDYHVRGRQMLRGSTQEPDLGQESGTEDEEDYSRDTVRQNAAADDDSSDDDILYQNSGIIPAKSLAFLPMALPAESARRSPENAPIVPSHNSAHPVRRSPESASVVVSHSDPRESLASENADQSMNDNELLGTDDNEPDSDWERDDSASDSAQNFKLRKRTGNKNRKGSHWEGHPG
ncbi:hypothetical protein GMDG_06234 [Pseudogymnoascus destructans 20631-21]|uniref:Uncharacterized protein n=1 Tax=Pseudogymnoascus destructans (strain ATCC MYA-4855 / 20631-21) TaxID=658429 RepID=L8FRI2_PSED2|nr:hypothetical protein GMDG_06234 [Pseudogymnoascus destructans 20631-21]